MPLLELSGISKRFGPTQALRDVDLAVEPGEVRGLVGENGSGKTTLIRILAGEIAPDAGDLLVDDQRLADLDATGRLTAGVGVVFQEAKICPDLTVAENLYLGRLPRRRGIVRWRQVQREAQAVLDEAGFPLRAGQRVRQISQDAQHLTEVARVLARGARVLAFDETTASLTADHVERIFDVIRRRRAAGAAVVFVSHRLHEVREICDRITVLRDGQVTGTVDAATATEAEIVRLMVGRSLESQFVRTPAGEKGAVGLRVRELRAGPLRAGIDLDVRAGEVVGVAGLVGSGRSTLLEAVFGLVPRSGTVEVGGRTVAPANPRAAIAAGMGFVPEDRRTQGLAVEQSVTRNATMVLTGRRSLAALPARRQEAEVVAEIFERLALRAADADAPVRTLSGGNQQKIVLGRWLWHRPPVLLLDEPTRGIDVGAKREIYDLIEQLASEGTAVLLVSSELPEVMGLCDRIVVLREGAAVGAFGRGVGEETLAAAMSGAGTSEARGGRGQS